MSENTSQSALGFEKLLDEIASKTPSPGGGFVASAVGALGASLGSMVLAYSIGKKTLAEHDVSNRQALERLDRARSMLLELAHEDAEAYERLNSLQKQSPQTRGRDELLEAARLATSVPMSGAAVCSEVLRVLESLVGTTNRWLASDLAIASILAQAALRSCVWNVRINLPTLRDSGESADRLEAMGAQVEGLVRDATARAGEIERRCLGSAQS
ncbi:MAG: cyclodeaminase/cyclohydrolase family protein [Planctomycetota bacterium]|jgi:formiminotetrahydrofolate cyclodeaminase